MVDKKYIQVMTLHNEDNYIKDVVYLCYKGEGVAELYVPDVNALHEVDLLAMHPSTRKAWVIKEYGYLIEDLRDDLLDDTAWAKITVSRKKLMDNLFWD